MSSVGGALMMTSSLELGVAAADIPLVEFMSSCNMSDFFVNVMSWMCLHSNQGGQRGDGKMCEMHGE